MPAPCPLTNLPRCALHGAMLLALFFCALAKAATYHVAPDGDDSHSGSIEQPFASLQRAQLMVEPGDTVLLRGGIYDMSATPIASSNKTYAYVVHLDKSGRPGQRINYWAYSGERPVFDYARVKPADLRVTGINVTGSWIHLRGIEIIGVQVTLPGHTQSECIDNSGDHNIYERCVMRDGMAIGFNLRRGSHNLILNCDAYRNWDSVSENGRGGNVDGFGAHPNRPSHVGNVFRGCRAWLNSDDGFDCISAYAGVTFENCWSFFNGYTSDFIPRADGNGFKVGGYGAAGGRHPDPVPRHTTRYCLAVGNKNAGFYANHHIGGGDWINNTAYLNATNYNLLSALADNDTSVPGYGHCLRNNLGFAPRSVSVSNLDETRSDVAHNFFNLPVNVSEADFLYITTDRAELLALLSTPRQPDGTLPQIPLLRLAPGSDLIDAGKDFGLPYSGSAPDLGAFETVSPPASPSAASAR